MLLVHRMKIVNSLIKLMLPQKLTEIFPVIRGFKSRKKVLKLTPLSVIFFILAVSLNNYAQEVKVYDLLGKHPAEIIEKFGDPVYLDSTVSSAVCIFYKYPTGSMSFVADSAGVYQAESSLEFKIKRDARSELNSILKNTSSAKFVIDEETENDVRLRKPGVLFRVELTEDKVQRRYEVKLKANKSEY